MKNTRKGISTYFHNLLDAYASEIDDLSTDSEGGDVLKEKIRDKRDALDDLWGLSEEFPELLAVVLHNSVRFKDRAALDRLVGGQPGRFPAWSEVSKAVEFHSGATEVVRDILEKDNGDAFLCVAVGLEYLLDSNVKHGLTADPSASNTLVDDDSDEAGEHAEANGDGERFDDDGDADGDDLNQRGAGWLEEQGFDKLD